MKDRGLRFLIAMGISVMVASFSATLFAQFAPPTAGPVANEVAAPISNSIASPIKQSAFGVGTDGTTTIPTDTLFQIMTFGSFTNSLDVQGTGGTQNLMRLESGNLSHKTGQILIDSDVTNQYPSWVPSSGYSLDTDGPMSVNTFYVQNAATITGNLNLLAMQTGSGSPKPVCATRDTGKLIACPPAPVVTVTANPTSVTPPFGTTVITWSSTNSTSCTSPDFSTAGATSGSVTMHPLAVTTYTVNCTNASGMSGSGSVTVTLNLPPTATITANPTFLTAPGNVAITWTSTNATTCTGINFSTGNATNGTVTVAQTTTKTYTLTCTNAINQSVIKVLTVPVSTTPVITFTANPPTITTTQLVTLTWSTQNAISCAGTNFSTNGDPAGSATVSQSATRTYTITCTSSAGTTATKTLTVYLIPTVLLTPSTLQLTANNAIPTITDGSGNVTLTWTSTNAISCTGGSNGGNPPFTTNGQTSGSMTVNITATTTFNLNCVNSTGQVVSAIPQDVVVKAPPPNTTFCIDEYHLVGGVWTLFGHCAPYNTITPPFDYNFATHSSTSIRRFKIVNPTMTYPSGGTNPTCTVDVTGDENSVETTATTPFWAIGNNYITDNGNYSGQSYSGPFSYTPANAIAAFHQCAQGSGCETHDVVPAPYSYITFGWGCQYTDMQGNGSLVGGNDYSVTVGAPNY